MSKSPEENSPSNIPKSNVLSRKAGCLTAARRTDVRKTGSPDPFAYILKKLLDFAIKISQFHSLTHSLTEVRPHFVKTGQAPSLFYAGRSPPLHNRITKIPVTRRLGWGTNPNKNRIWI